jgi:hypothetical protein
MCHENTVLGRLRLFSLEMGVPQSSIRSAAFLHWKRALKSDVLRCLRNLLQFHESMCSGDVIALLHDLTVIKDTACAPTHNERPRQVMPFKAPETAPCPHPLRR